MCRKLTKGLDKHEHETLGKLVLNNFITLE